jgi:hypothetical protein
MRPGIRLYGRMYFWAVRCGVVLDCGLACAAEMKNPRHAGIFVGFFRALKGSEI